MGQTTAPTTVPTAAPTKTERVLHLARELGVLRSRDLAAQGIARKSLTRLVGAGLLERTGRGLYVLPDAAPTEFRSLAETAKRIPVGVVCLLSAVRFHHLTAQTPVEVWLAIPPGARRPRASFHAGSSGSSGSGDTPLHVVRFSGQALTEGIEEHVVEGVRVQVYTPAKTVADCFKFRNKIGLDVALDALREAWRARHATMDELWRFAEVCHVTTVMRPYLEALISLERPAGRHGVTRGMTRGQRHSGAWKEIVPHE